MRILFCEADSVGDVQHRRPTYAALTRAGHELALLAGPELAVQAGPEVKSILLSGPPAPETTRQALKAYRPELVILASAGARDWQGWLSETLGDVPFLAAPEATNLPPSHELELRSQLASAHVEIHESRTRRIDAERSLLRLRRSVDTRQDTILTLGQALRSREQEAERLRDELSRLQAENARINGELHATTSSLWWRTGNVLRRGVRRFKRALSA